MNIERGDAVWPDQDPRVLLRELADRAGLSETEVMELVECGALTVSDERSGQRYFSVRSVTVARMARRLRDEFELEPHGAALLLLYVERIRALERELAELRARLSR